MSPPEREDWEIAVRDTTQTYVTQQLALPGRRMELLGAVLEGTYPDTELVLCFDDRRSRADARQLDRRYAIWRIPSLHPRPEVEEPAASAAVMLAAWALDG